jgi:anti-sigma regulatory factor (Ser/Thr protein kinase)
MKKNGLSGNLCKGFLVEGDSVLWATTNKGLDRISFCSGNICKYTIRHYSRQNGLDSDDINDVVRVGNKLWVVHANSITIADPSAFFQNDHRPPVHIREVITQQTGKAITSGVQLSHDNNSIRFSFTGISLLVPGEAGYRYRMLGIDSAWTYSALTSVEYPSLPPGEYCFQVMARNNDGYWSAKAASFAFIILPAWWQTWWFYLFVLLLFLSLVFLVFRWRLKVIKEKQKRRLAQEAMLLSSELKALRAQMNPHFMFNVINSVQYFVTNNDPESSQKYLSKFARLMRYIVDHAGTTDMTLQQEAEALQLYLDLEALRFGEFFHYQISIHLDEDDRYIRVPSMVIQPFVENAIWHGIMHKKNSVGKITVDFKKIDNRIQVVLEDNGPGRAFTAQLKEKRSNHQSVGTQNTNDRINMINQMKHQQNTVETIDLFDEQGNPAGTRVILFFDIQ